MLLGILDAILAGLLIPSICIVIGMYRELKATRAKLEETQAQLKKTRQSLENAMKLSGKLLEEKQKRRM